MMAARDTAEIGLASTKAAAYEKAMTGRVLVDDARVDRLKEQLMSTPQTIDNERVRLMMDVYDSTAGSQQIIRRAQFLAYIL
jgi:hypothetical protein